jgi:coenzyme F420-0:L-glutamate ligase/coenzyme F420-1:gamma-L-glutamate ligase
MVKPGDDLAALLIAGLDKAGIALGSSDILVLAQKIVSKAENRYVDLNAVTPGAKAKALAEETGKDARLIEVILSEAKAVIRARPGLIIVEHRLGFIMANAGIDRSNIDRRKGAELVLLLPEDPDRTAAGLRAELARRTGCDVAIAINDSFGRPWRNGVTGVLLGASGMSVLADLTGKQDLTGRELETTQHALGDELAAAASLLMGQADNAVPAVHIRGAARPETKQTAQDLIRPADQDLFR